MIFCSEVVQVEVLIYKSNTPTTKSPGTQLMLSPDFFVFKS